MCRNCSLEASELVQHCRKLELENATLRGAVRLALCGELFNGEVACQLHRAHIGSHAWADPASEILIRW